MGQSGDVRIFSIDLGSSDPELVTDRCWVTGAAGIWETDDATWRVGVEDENVGTFLAAVGDWSPVDVTDTEAVELSTRDVAVDGIVLTVPPTVFGDGDHPTTTGCLEVLAEVVQAGHRALDVGCGTGVLAIAAARAGAIVTAIDVDDEAVEATAANAAANDVDVAVSTTPLAEITGPFDVVVANITAGAIGPLLLDLVRCTKDPGHLIVSGILDDQWPDIESGLRSLLGDQSAEVSHTSHDGWVTATLRLVGS